MQQHIRTIIKFLRSYGAVNIKANSAGSGNTRIDYVWKGEAKFSLVSSTPSDNRALSNIIADIRRLLGPPIQPELKMRSTLEELTAEAQRRADAGLPIPVAPDLDYNVIWPGPLSKELAEIGKSATQENQAMEETTLKTFTGRVAHYPNNSIHVVLPVDGMIAFEHEGSISMASLNNNWILLNADSQGKSRFRPHNASNGFVAAFPGNITTLEWPLFGRTSVKMFIRKGRIEARIDFATVRPIQQRHIEKETPPKSIWDVPEPAPKPSLPAELRPVIIDNAYLRNIIVSINDIEARSPYKLKRIDDAWTWAAYVTADDD